MGGTVDDWGGGHSAGPASVEGAGLQDVDRGRTRGVVRPDCGLVRGVVDRARQEVECDTLGMSAAQRLAAQRALAGLGVVPDRVLIDGNWDFVGGGRTRMIVKGDAKCLSIAAASILAKVTRDRIMRAEAPSFPGFDFELNKGYPCPRHKTALAAYGPTSIHRRSWVFMDSIPWTGIPRTPPVGSAAQGSLF